MYTETSLAKMDEYFLYTYRDVIYIYIYIYIYICTQKRHLYIYIYIYTETSLAKMDEYVLEMIADRRATLDTAKVYMYG